MPAHFSPDSLKFLRGLKRNNTREWFNARKPVYESVEEHGHEVHVFKGWEVVKPGLQSPEQYDESVADLVNYLQWMAEPVHNTRVRLGVGVLLFLLVLTAVTWRLNAAFWKEVK